MKYLFLLFIACTVFLNVNAQDYKFVYYFDGNLSFTSKDAALAIGKAYKKDDLVIVDCFSKASGKIIFTASFKDSSLQTMNGLYTSYYDDNIIETQGVYNEGEMDGWWKSWNKYGLITDSIFYNTGVRTIFGKYLYGFNKYYKVFIPTLDSIKKDGYDINYSYTDSLNNTLYERKSWIENGVEKIRYEVNFKGDKGLLKDYDSTGNIKTDSVFTRKINYAEFPGGEGAWREFLYKNLNIDILSKNNAPSGVYTVIVKFMVNNDGTVDEVVAENDAGYGTAAEAVRVIKLSRKWKPALQYGKYLRAYRRQPVSFSIQN